MSFNTQNMNYIADNILRALNLCKENKTVWQSDKYAMIRLIQADNPKFYELYPRICRIICFEDDISPLLGMMNTFAKVQNGELSLEKANDAISGALNAKYVDPILNSDKLVKERDEKKAQAKASNSNSTSNSNTSKTSSKIEFIE
jgi:hypothetical protein